MLKPPSECFRDNVLPRWQAYLSDPSKEWKAIDAARATNSHLEWVYWYYDENGPSRLMGAKDVPAFRQKLCCECSEILIVRDIADAAGHRKLTHGQTSRMVHLSTDALEEIASRWYFEGQDFLEILRVVVNFWRRWQD